MEKDLILHKQTLISTSMKKCKRKDCTNTFRQYNSLQTYCSAQCKKADKGFKAINKVSAKRKVENDLYPQLRKTFLLKPENKFCPVIKQLQNIEVLATTIHHKKGRIGKLLLDTRYWVALSMEGHEYVENNPIWAKENGYSLNRL